jgi:hypothetical protein
MLIPVPQRARVIPNDEVMEVLHAWAHSADTTGERGARMLHIKSLHTPRGIGAKALGLFWLDVPFRTAGAAVRAGYRPGETCPLCLALAAEGRGPRG